MNSICKKKKKKTRYMSHKFPFLWINAYLPCDGDMKLAIVNESERKANSFIISSSPHHSIKCNRYEWKMCMDNNPMQIQTHSPHTKYIPKNKINHKLKTIECVTFKELMLIN